MTETHLFPPANAVRMKSDAFLGTPLPPEERKLLTRRTAQSSTTSCQLVQLTFRSTFWTPTGRRFAATRAANIRLRRHRLLRLRRDGLNSRACWRPQRAVIGLSGICATGRSGLPDSGDDDEEDQRWSGPLVIPGKYHVRLTVDGRAMTAPVQVIKDPRTSASQAIMAEQFNWALKRLYRY